MRSQTFLAGVVEGFYGRCWPFETRLVYAEYLREAGLNTYIYCPKNDPFLRRKWQEDWPANSRRELKQLAGAYKRQGICWGVGLSPVELYRNYGEKQKGQLRRKLENLGELGAPIIAILFDDMPGNLDSLATRQAEIISDACQWLAEVQVIVCPTYYSFDPVLEKFFGSMPSGYWEQLGRELPGDTQVFWTGNQVCSQTIDVADIQDIVTRLGRPVTLWDNYPVNDSAARSNYLYTSKLSARPAELRPLLRGHLCNPMNQGLLSLPALRGLAELYGGDGLDDAAMSRILGAQTWRRLLTDWLAFETLGLSGLGEQQCRRLAAVYDSFDGAAAVEIVEWLRGEYAFDPSCLTE